MSRDGSTRAQPSVPIAMTCCEPLFGGLNLSCDTLVTIGASRRPHPRRARTYQEFRMILFFLLHCWSNSAKASHSKEMTLEEAMAVAINIHCSSESELAPRCLKLAWGSLIAIHLRGGQVMGERRLSGLWSVGHILAWSPPSREVKTRWRKGGQFWVKMGDCFITHKTDTRPEKCRTWRRLNRITFAGSGGNDTKMEVHFKRLGIC